MDENEKKETDETLKADANEAPKTDEAKETSKTDVNEQPKKEKTITAKDKFAFYSFIFFLIAITFCIIIASNQYSDTNTSTSTSSDDDTYYSSSSDYDTDEDYDTSSSYSSDDDTSSSSSTIDDSDWDYSALEDDTLNIDSYDYESQNCYNRLLDYLDLMGFSRNGLIHQLQYDGYTDEAINNALYVLEGNKYVSWDIEAVKKAQEYMETFSFSQQRLYEQLIHDGFTEEQAN